MKVFVTGATGFIGSNLVKKLIAEDYEVSALVRLVQRRKLPSKVKLIKGDLIIPSSLKNISADIIFHLAAGLPYHHLSDVEYKSINVKGVENLLKNCNTKKIKRFILVSTVGIYDLTSRKIINESSKIKLTSAYETTKYNAERKVKTFCKEKGIPFSIIRPTICYGPGDTRPGFLNLFRLIKKKIFIPIGNGRNFFHTIYIDNLVDALILAATKKEAIDEDFIIGDEPCPTMDQILNKITFVQKSFLIPVYIPKEIAVFIGEVFNILGKLGLPAPLNSQRVKFMTEDKQFSIDKAKKVLGYNPKINLTVGIDRTYKWYKNNGYL